MKEDQNQGK